MKRLLTAIILLCCVAMSYAASPTKTPVGGYPKFALGADLSWTPYIEANQLHTYYIDGEAITIPDMVSHYGIDAVRLRVWVNPKADKAVSGFKFSVGGATYEEMSTFGTCAPEEMVALAKRFAKQGQRLMITFQMSDTWADPARQFIPESWADCNSVDELSAKASAHVKEVLTMLYNANVNVAWVQIGNETNTGMLKWKLPTSASGTTSVSSVSWGCEVSQKSSGVPSETTKNFVKVFGDAAKAAKTVYPNTKIVLHLTKTSEWNTLNWALSLLNKAGLSADICDYIGLSLYPGIDDGQDGYTAKWKTYADKGITTINNIYKNYGFRTLLCEIGMNNEWSESTTAADQASNIMQCNVDVRDFTQYLIDQLATDDSTCDGLFYWEPETDYMKNYTKGACVSANPGSSWPRDKLVPNAWWETVKASSTFPLDGLKDYAINPDTTPDDDKPGSHQQLYLYYYDGSDHYMPMTTADGVVYRLTNFSVAQWFKFKIVTRSWSFSVGDVEVGIGNEVTLSAEKNWDAWTNVAVPATCTWWFNLKTRAFKITEDQVCPWNTGVASVPADSCSPTYYNLQGVKVERPASGVYIIRRGRTAHKVFFKY